MKRKTIFIILIIIIFLLLIYPLFFKEINLYLNIPYHNPTYILTIDDKRAGMNVEAIKKIKIIPKVLSINLVKDIFQMAKNENYDYEKSKLNIKGYYCYSSLTGKKKKTSCSNNLDNYTLEEIDNIQITKMTIRGGSSSGWSSKLLYEGEYLDNINSYLEANKNYTIYLDIKHENIYSTLEILIKTKNSEN